MTNQIEHVNRMLSMYLSEGKAELAIPVTLSLPGNVVNFNDPEVTVLAARATALDGEICANFGIVQDTYYVVEETGLVEKTTTTYRCTQLLAAGGVKPGHSVELEAEASFMGSWMPEPLTVRRQVTTMLTGTCKVKVNYRVKEEQEITFLKPSGLDGEMMSETVDVEAIVGLFEQTINLALPVAFGETPQGLGEMSATLTNLAVTPLSGWVKVEGDIIAAVSYLGQNGIPQEESFVYPVKYFIEATLAQSEMMATVSGKTEILTCVRAQGEQTGMLRGLLYLEGKLTRLESLTIGIQTRNHESSWPGHHSGHKDYMGFEEVVGVGSSQTLIQRDLYFKRKVRYVREPIDAQVRNLQHEIIHNKVIIRGILHKQLFLVDADTSVVFAHDVDESFVHFVDVPGASPGMRAHVTSRVEFVKVDLNPDRESARQVTIIELRVKVFRFFKKDIIIKPPYEPILPIGKPKPYGKIYVVRSGDSVWKIAQMFGVSMESIIAANNLQNPNLIFPGQQLIIPGRW